MTTLELNGMQRGLVPSRVCVRYTGLHHSTLIRAIESKRLKGERIGSKKWFVDWADFRRYVGPTLAQGLPVTASAAMEQP